MANPQIHLPAVGSLLESAEGAALSARYGRALVTQSIRDTLSEVRDRLLSGQTEPPAREAIFAQVTRHLSTQTTASLRPVFNLTGTVLHTNLGRAPLPLEAIEAVSRVAGAVNLEYDLDAGQRGDRDSHLEELICRLTGAQAATVVNNNAAAVLLLLNALAAEREVLVSRGELVEIGGSFRMPDIMRAARCRLIEVGTTNRTHRKDFAEAIGPQTALLLKVHTSNYQVVGFTAAVKVEDMAQLAHQHGLPLAMDLGSGSLVDFREYGLPHEPTARELLAQGCDLITFSGDKLLGGPQAGIIAGRREFIAAIKKNPLKRALRVDKMTIAALAAVLRLYLDPNRLPERLPSLRFLTRPLHEIRALAETLQPVMAATLSDGFLVEMVDCESEVGSGAFPAQGIASAGLAIKPKSAKGGGTALAKLETALRRLPTPILARIHEGALILDLRCLQDEEGFRRQVALLRQELAA